MCTHGQQHFIADEAAGSFIETPALEVAAELRTEDQARSLIGKQLGPYQIHSMLGAGGMGEVYSARDTRLDRDVAVKVLPAHLAQDRESLARFKREAKTVARGSHLSLIGAKKYRSSTTWLLRASKAANLPSASSSATFRAPPPRGRGED